MSSPLTKHIEAFNAATFPSKEILDIIGKVLKSKMRERNLWEQQPSLLGYSYHQKWNDKEAFPDILIDCYEYSILKRYQALKAQASTKENIDGLVFLNISHFLQDRQQAHDPEGYAIFKNVEAVLQDLSSLGSIQLDNLRDEKKIRNETICILTDQYNKAFIPDYGLIKQTVGSHPEHETIVNAAIKISVTNQQSLSSLIIHLKQRGVAAFRVKDLVDILKDASRSVAVEVLSSDFETDFRADTSELTVSYDNEAEASMDAVAIQEKINKEIDKLKKHGKVKLRLHLLLTIMLNRIANGEDDSITDIAREMGESKSTISEDWTLLRSLAKKS